MRDHAAINLRGVSTMMHAFAIGHDGPVAAAAISRLWEAGYHSIFRVDEPREAASLLACAHPDLILILPDAAARDSMNELRRIGTAADAPVIVATHDVDQALDCLGPVMPLEQAFRSTALQEARLPLAA